MDNLHSRIKLTRIELGLSQAQLAEKTGVSQPTVANWENGSHIPRSAVLARIGTALGVTPFWLLSGSELGSEAPSLYYLQQPIRHIPVYPWPESGPRIRSNTPTGYMPYATNNKNLFGLAARTQDSTDHEVLICDPNGRLWGRAARYLLETRSDIEVQQLILEPNSVSDNLIGQLVARLIHYG